MRLQSSAPSNTFFNIFVLRIENLNIFFNLFFLSITVVTVGRNSSYSGPTNYPIQSLCRRYSQIYLTGTRSKAGNGQWTLTAGNR